MGKLINHINQASISNIMYEIIISPNFTIETP